jgi:hypothetical protein
MLKNIRLFRIELKATLDTKPKLHAPNVKKLGGFFEQISSNKISQVCAKDVMVEVVKIMEVGRAEEEKMNLDILKSMSKRKIHYFA